MYFFTTDAFSCLEFVNQSIGCSLSCTTFRCWCWFEIVDCGIQCLCKHALWIYRLKSSSAVAPRRFTSRVNNDFIKLGLKKNLHYWRISLFVDFNYISAAACELDLQVTWTVTLKEIPCFKYVGHLCLIVPDISHFVVCNLSSLLCCIHQFVIVSFWILILEVRS